MHDKTRLHETSYPDALFYFIRLSNIVLLPIFILAVLFNNDWLNARGIDNLVISALNTSIIRAGSFLWLIDIICTFAYLIAAIAQRNTSRKWRSLIIMAVFCLGAALLFLLTFFVRQGIA